MVVLTAAYIERECTRVQSTKSLTKGLDKNHLKNISHLYMNGKFIHAIGDFSICKNLRVIYLHNNCISKIENLNFAGNLVNLYLQCNDLTKIENLEALRSLEKLYLGHNRISVLEGLENLGKLKELGMEKQRLVAGQSLVFEPRTIAALAFQLKMLNVRGNGLTSLRPISSIVSLEILEAQDNLLEDMEDLTISVSDMKMLSELYLQGNPITRTYRYRENLIANSDSLVNLDGKPITEICRRFLKNFKEEKQLRQSKKRTKLTLTDDISSSLNLPPAFERSVSRAIIHQQPVPKFTLNVASVSAGSEPQVFPAWKSTSAISGTTSNSRIAPRPFWRNPPMGERRRTKKTTAIIDTSVFSKMKN